MIYFEERFIRVKDAKNELLKGHVNESNKRIFEGQTNYLLIHDLFEPRIKCMKMAIKAGRA